MNFEKHPPDLGYIDNPEKNDEVIAIGKFA